MILQKRKELHFHCPIEASLSLIGNKWKGAIAYHLASGTKRYNELRRLIPHITQRMLTLQLREMEKADIVARSELSTVSLHVEYSLTENGKGLLPVLAALEVWGKHMMTASANEID